MMEAKDAFDHLLVGAPDLHAAIQWFWGQTGVRPVPGGSHPGRGTRNALVSLGGLHYLELIAPDPEQKNVADDRGLKTLKEPTPIGWAVRSNDLEDVRRRAQAAGLKFSGPTPGARNRPDGKTLRWSTLNLEAAGPLAPFFIQWSADTAHPSQDAPKGCSLASLTFFQPNARDLRHVLQVFGLRAHVENWPSSRKPGISIELATLNRPLKIAIDFLD